MKYTLSVLYEFVMYNNYTTDSFSYVSLLLLLVLVCSIATKESPTSAHEVTPDYIHILITYFHIVCSTVVV